MKRKLLITWLMMLVMFSQPIYATSIDITFTDVKGSDWFYTDVMALAEQGIINGYLDGSFKPTNTISVAGFIKLAVVAQNYTLSANSTEHWYSPYVDAALQNGLFSPSTFEDYTRPITRAEMALIISNSLALSANNLDDYKLQIRDYDSIPIAYIEPSMQVYVAGIITGYPDGTIKPSNPAQRSEASVVIVRMLNEQRRLVPEALALLPTSKTYTIENLEIGMSSDYASQVHGQPTDILVGQYGITWWVYDLVDDFFILGIADNKIVSLYSNLEFDSMNGSGIGSSLQVLEANHSGNYSQDAFVTFVDGMKVSFYIDEVDQDGVEAIYMIDSSMPSLAYTQSELNGMERLLLHLINSTREKFSLSELSWSDQARLSSYLHSKDMADQDYFAHTNLSGLEPWERMEAVGIDYAYAAENLAGGYITPFDIHFGLMNSPGHRLNILNSNVTQLGVGMYYKEDSTYRIYTTENYFKGLYE